MTVSGVIYSGFYYLCLPVYIAVVSILSWILLLLSPVLHVGHYILHAVVIVPFQLLSKFESVYIFLGVAAVIGVITGAALHVSSGIMMATMNLQSTPTRKKNSKSKSKGKAIKAKHESQAPLSGSYNDMSRDYKDWLDKDRGSKARGLVSQTILEEEDSSDVGF